MSVRHLSRISDHSQDETVPVQFVTRSSVASCKITMVPRLSASGPSLVQRRSASRMSARFRTAYLYAGSVPSPNFDVLAPRCATVTSSMDSAYAIGVVSTTAIPPARTARKARTRFLMALLARGSGEVDRAASGGLVQAAPKCESERANLTKRRHGSANRHAVIDSMRSSVLVLRRPKGQTRALPAS